MAKELYSGKITVKILATVIIILSLLLIADEYDLFGSNNTKIFIRPGYEEEVERNIQGDCQSIDRTLSTHSEDGRKQLLDFYNCPPT